MSKTMPLGRIPLILALMSGFGISAAQANAVEDDFNAVDQVMDRKIAHNVPYDGYKDDRSSPEALIESFYNAINNGEFSRAYSYHDSLPAFPSWVLGYENTRSIKLHTGEPGGDGGAGTMYWYLPVAIEAESYDGKKEVFGGCYIVALGAPANQEAPPFRPMSIMSGSLKKTTKSPEDSLPKDCTPGG